MRCPNCGFENPIGCKFCGMCGTVLARACVVCGSTNPLVFRFCGQCGTSLLESEIDSPVALPEPQLLAHEPSSEPSVSDALVPTHEIQLEGERRLVTVILADVSQSTDLLEEIGTERWVAIMNRALQIMEAEVYRYGGEVDQFRGDGLVALFGATMAHEDDAVRAVLAALAIQEAIQPYADELADQEQIDLRLRVGVNSGEVIVANIGDRAQHSEDTAMGEAIALAARMETAAEPSTVLISENTYQLVQSEFSWRPLGEIAVKGIGEPVRVYRPLSPTPDAQRSRRLAAYGLPTILVGRDQEAKTLARSLRDLGSGRGGIVCIIADEGMGKSHLVSQVRGTLVQDRLESDPDAHPEFTWLEARCRSHEQAWPYAMWLDLGRRWLQVDELDNDEAVLDRLRERTEMLWGDAYEEHYPYLAFWLSLPLEDRFISLIQRQSAEGLRQRLFTSIRSWVKTLSEQGPVALAFEDVHWVDTASLELLRHCLPVSESSPVQWWLMFRPERTSAIWDFRHYLDSEYPHRTTTVSLLPMDEAECNRMLDRLVGSDVLPDSTRALIVEKAEGNPYYIEELISSLAREGALVRDAWTGRWRATRAITTIELPDTLRGLLLSRIDGLAPQERHVLQLAAVIGTVFWESVLVELVGDREAVIAHLTAVQRAELVHERGRVPELGREYAFKSSLIRDAAYESILSPQRMAYHQQVADHLAGFFGQEALAQYYGVIAYHYRHAKDQRKELFYVLSAAEHAQEIYANDQAMAHYVRAIELLDSLEGAMPEQVTQDWSLEALQGLGQVAFGLGDIGRAEGYFREAIALGKALARSPRLLVRLCYWLAEALFWQNRYNEQIEIAKEGLALVGFDAESLEAVLMGQEIAIGSLELGDVATFREYTYRTATFLRDLPYVQELRPAYSHVSKAFRVDKDLAQAMDWLDELRERAERHQDLRALGEAYYLQGDILADQGDLIGALAREQEALKLFAEIGDTKHESWCLGNAGWAAMMLGDFDLAESYVHRGLELARAIGNKRDVAWGDWRLGQIALCKGDFRQGLVAFEDAAQLFLDIGRRRSEIRAIYAVGRIRLAMGEMEQALGYFQQAAVLAEPDAYRQDTFSLAAELNALELASENTEAFRRFCESFKREHPEIAAGPLVQWYLEPTEALTADELSSKLVFIDSFDERVDSGWQWHDPMGDSEYVIHNGLELAVAPGRDLWLVNLGAPRLQRAAHGDWQAQTVCGPVKGAGMGQEPVIGGMVLWQNDENYMRLDRGAGGEREVSFLGCIENRDVVVGRGWLPDWLGSDGDVFLRIRYVDGIAEALCSVDGEMWFAVGWTAFPDQDNLRLGLYGIGVQDPLLYPGRCRGSHSIRFRALWLWQV